jgi:putative oxidoreductase
LVTKPLYMYKNPISILSRILFAVVMLAFAISHFMNTSAMTGMIPSYLPQPVIWVYLSGTALTLAGVAFILNKKIKLAAYLLGLLLFIYVFVIHVPHLLGGDQCAIPMVLKDAALAAAAFFIGSVTNE